MKVNSREMQQFLMRECGCGPNSIHQVLFAMPLLMDSPLNKSAVAASVREKIVKGVDGEDNEKIVTNER